MGYVLTLVVVIIVLAIVIAFLQRFYRKATRERALIRTGAGGKRVVLDGGFLALPFLHRVEEINMRTMRLPVSRTGAQSLMTEDRLRLDVIMEFYLRVEPSVDGVSTAAQALGARALNPDELSNLFEGRFIDAIQAVVASKTMDELHENRSAFVSEVKSGLDESLGQNGLKLESASLTTLDQASFSALDENNAFNAVGMRRLAEIISTNKKKRAEIEADADVSVRQTQLDGLKRKLEIDREQQEAEISQTLSVEEMKADSQAKTESARQSSQRQAEQARISREMDVRMSEIERDKTLRETEAKALLAAESAKVDSQIALTRKRIEETETSAEAERVRKQVIEAQEEVQAEKERLAAERERETAKIRVKQESEVSTERARSEVETLLERVQAEAKATDLKAAARRNELKAEAEGKAALIEAENARSSEQVRMKVEMHKIDKLPELAERMMKPVEKIDSIRINQVSGLGSGTQAGDASGGAVGNAVDGVLNLAFQLPAMQKLGESIGLNLDLGQLGENGDGAVDVTPKTSSKGGSGDKTT